MTLLAYQTQGACSTFDLRANPCSKGVKLKPSVAFQYVARTDLKHRFPFRGKPFVPPEVKPFKVSSFKGNAQNNELESGTSSSKICKSPLQLSCSQQDQEETISESPHLQKHGFSCVSEETESTSTGSLAIQKLFRKWLIMLRTQTSSSTMDEYLSDRPIHIANSQSQLVKKRTKAGEMLKAAMGYFFGLDAAISLTLLTFIPWYLTVRLVHGAEVAKELMPLWVLGPLIVALYVKIIQALCSLYVFCFKQVIRLVKNLPTYYLLIYSYIAEGKLKASFWPIFCKPIVDIINMDYKELFRQKWMQLAEWAVEKYQDYVESIWPYYCRTIRFMIEELAMITSFPSFAVHFLLLLVSIFSWCHFYLFITCIKEAIFCIVFYLFPQELGSPVPLLCQNDAGV